MLAVHKYLALLRSSDFPSWYQQEIRILSDTGFRFLEKGRPDDYAVWVAEHMARPLPLQHLLSASRLVEDWEGPQGEEEVRDILNSLTVDTGRTVLMGKPNLHEKVHGKDLVWEKEKWYKTPYRVERLDSTFVEQVSQYCEYLCNC